MMVAKVNVAKDIIAKGSANKKDYTGSMYG